MVNGKTHLRPIQVVLFERKPLSGQRSLERVFDTICRATPEKIVVQVRRMPFESRGVARRVGNLLYTWWFRGAVNHVAGDIHYAALALPRRRTVLTITDLVGLEGGDKWRTAILEVLWYKLPVWWVCKVITISEWTRARLIEVTPRAQHKTVAIPCPLPCLPTVALRKHVNTPPILLQVGTGPNKNLHRVIEAVQGLNLHLRIVGPLSGEHLSRLRRHEIDYSNAVAIDDDALSAEYQRCDAVIFASTYEGFGLPIIEAQSVGRPVITSGIGPMDEVAGAGALFVNPYSVTEIRSAITELLAPSLEIDEVVASGFRNVERFRPDVVASAYADIWEQVAVSNGN